MYNVHSFGLSWHWAMWASAGPRNKDIIVRGAGSLEHLPFREHPQQRQLLWIGPIDIPGHYLLKSVWLPAESPTFVGLLGCRLLLMMMTTKVGCAPVTHPLDMFRARFVLVLSVVIMPQTYVSPSLKSHMSLDTDVATHACHGLGITYSFGHITLIIAGINDLKITGS